MDSDVRLRPFEREGKTRLVYGPGALARLPELVRGLGGRRVLLVSDRGLVAAGHAPRAGELLRAAGVAVELWSDVEQDPDADEVARCAARARAHGTELFVALGGGSAIDTAKGAAMLATSGGSMQDLWGDGRTKAPAVPMVAVPTTAGTGSEVQRFALVTDAASGQKMACGAPDAAPRVALLDPELTLTLPPEVTAHAGLDALGHAVETAVTRARTPLSDLYALEAFRLLAAHFAAVLARPDDLGARGAMLVGAAFAGLAIEHSMLGAAHALANALTARFPMVHGVAVGLMLPHVVRFNAAQPAARARYAELGALAGVGGDPAEGLAAFLEASLERAGLPLALGCQQVGTEDLAPLAGFAARQWTAHFNPVPVGPVELERILGSALHAPRSNLC